MQSARSASAVFCLVLALSATARAQAPAGSPRQPNEGIYVSVFSGATFGPPAAATFAGEYTDRIHRNVHAYATLSYHENLMTSDLQDDLTSLGAYLTSVTGTNWQLTGRDRGVAFVAGAKYLVGSGVVRPYVGGGAGAINLRRRITERQVGDVTSAVLTEFGIGDISLTSVSLTRPIAEVTAGVGFHARRTYVDVGYRYRRAFQMTDTLDFSQLLVGVGVIF